MSKTVLLALIAVLCAVSPSFAYVSNVTNNAGASAEPRTTSSKDAKVPVEPNSHPPTRTEIARRRIAFVVDDYGLSAQSIAEGFSASAKRKRSS